MKINLIVEIIIILLALKGEVDPIYPGTGYYIITFLQINVHNTQKNHYPNIKKKKRKILERIFFNRISIAIIQKQISHDK